MPFVLNYPMSNMLAFLVGEKSD